MQLIGGSLLVILLSYVGVSRPSYFEEKLLKNVCRNRHVRTAIC